MPLSITFLPGPLVPLVDDSRRSVEPSELHSSGRSGWRGDEKTEDRARLDSRTDLCRLSLAIIGELCRSINRVQTFEAHKMSGEARLEEEVFLWYGRDIFYKSKGAAKETDWIRFKATFGTTPTVCCIIWDLLITTEYLPDNGRPFHLLWALMFLNLYCAESVHAALADCDEKTFRKWSWLFVDAISYLEDQTVSPCQSMMDCTVIDGYLLVTSIVPYLLIVTVFPSQICWENRLRMAPAGQLNCFVTVDGTDCQICEPKPFDTKWFSHKFKAAGLRWEVAVAIYSGDIVWINGPYPCGRWPDINIFRAGLKQLLEVSNEKAEADAGYRGDNRIWTPADDNAPGHMKADVRARHETCNKRLKQFSILRRTFRHDRDFHDNVFRAVVVVTQLSLENVEPLYGTPYEPF